MSARCVTFLFLVTTFAVKSALSAEITTTIKRDAAHGMNAAMSAIVPGQTFPSRAVPAFITADKKHAKESDAFQLGFAQTACSHMHVAYQFALSLSREELQQAGVGWVIFSDKALHLQIKMHLTDAQMKELFSAEGFRKIQQRPGPL